jgi:hypothetical protein
MPTGTENRMTYNDQCFYSPKMVFNRSLYPEDELIPIVYRVNTGIYQNGQQIATHNQGQCLQQVATIPAGNSVQPPIDQWQPTEPGDRIFSHIRGAVIAPVHKFYNMSDEDAANNMIDYFYVTSKRCYNSDTKIKDGEVSLGFRDHCTNYMNYFEKYYDTQKQLLGLYAQLKYFIDCEPKYNLDMFLHDLWKNFINPNASYTSQYLNCCLDKMNIEQYNLELNYKNNKSPVLEYNDFHAKIMLKISVMQNMMIPLLTHFITKKKIPQAEIKNVLLKAFDLLFQICNKIYNVDLGSKIYETTTSNVNKNMNNNGVLWDMQIIRGRNSTTHSVETVENIIMQIIPKYTYNKNIIHFNYNAINRDIKFRVTEVPYEFGFVVLSSSNRDEDNNSECDKFEAHAAKINEAIMMQTITNCKTTMKRIELKYGPFDEAEIEFYKKEMSRDGKFIVNSLQKTLVTYLFAKEFNDPQSTKIVDIRNYIILIIAAKRMLESYKMLLLPYMIGGRVNRVVTRKSINKKELLKIEASEWYPMIHEKYNNEKIEKEIILGLIAQILSSEFQTVDYYNREWNGVPITVVPDIVAEEVCRFVILI